MNLYKTWGYKARFPYDRYDPYNRCDRWKKCSEIAAIICKLHRNDRNDRDRWDRARVYLGDGGNRERSWILNTQLSQNAFQTIQYCGQNRTVYAISLAKIIEISTRYWNAGQRLHRNSPEVRLKQRRNSKTSEQHTISRREFCQRICQF